MEEDLEHRIDKSWDWKTNKLSDNEYLVVFPNSQILNTSKFKGIHMALNNISGASSVLQAGWVKKFGIPLIARSLELWKL